MEKIDGRKLTTEQLLKIRKLAFELIRDGVSNKEIAEKFGVHEVTVSTWKKKGLRIDKKGRKVGHSKSLNKYYEKKVYDKLIDATPEEYGSTVPFWTKKSISNLIKKEFNKDIPSSTLGDYLKNWNLNSDEVNTLKAKFVEAIGSETYINIKNEAKASYANLWWIKVFIVLKENSNEYHYHFIINDNIGLLMIRIYKLPEMVDCFKDFLLSSTKSTQKRLFLIVDGLTEAQYDELNTYIEDNYRKKILEFIPTFSL